MWQPQSCSLRMGGPERHCDFCPECHVSSHIHLWIMFLIPFKFWKHVQVLDIDNLCFYFLCYLHHLPTFGYHKSMKDLQREGEGGGGVGRGKGREGKEVRRGRERKRTMFARFTIGNKATRWCRILKKENFVFTWGNMICVLGFVKVAHGHTSCNPSCRLKCLLWTKERNYISRVLKRQQSMKCEISIQVWNAGAGENFTNLLRCVEVLLCPMLAFAQRPFCPADTSHWFLRSV